MVTGWDTKTVKELSTIFGRIGFRGYTKEDIVEPFDGAISLSPSNLKDGKIDVSSSTFISWFKYNESPEIKLENGDVVLVKTGSTYGKSAYIDCLSWPITLNPQILVFKNIKINKKLFAYFIQTPDFQKQIESTIVGGAIPTLSQNQVYQFKITVPNDEKEQENIAEALSNVDSMMSSLEKLIAKKKAVKQGAMQELLTGKKRLPGFINEWKYCELGCFVECVRGVSYKGNLDLFSSENNKTIRLLRSNNIQEAKFNSNDVQYIARDIVRANQILNKFDIMICMANGSKSLVGKNCIFNDNLNKKYTFGAFMSCLRAIKPEINMHYIFYLLNSTQYWDNIALLLSGSSINNLRPSDILEMKFYFPTIAEQKAIASILSDMDNEIEVLEQKLAKTRQLKQGMMQQLLTGKIRLI